MRIHGPNNLGGIRQESTDSPAKAKLQHNQPSAKDDAAVVTLGKTAEKANVASERLNDEIRSRLEEVRLQLSRNEYPIDLDRLAERIVDDELARSGT